MNFGYILSETLDPMDFGLIEILWTLDKQRSYELRIHRDPMDLG